jgi:trimethylamine--corrinoid protein Co-methyltransferase
MADGPGSEQGPASRGEAGDNGRATLRPRLTVWDENACRRVHEATLRVLASTGVDVHHEGARAVLAAAGARVDGARVRLTPALVAAALDSAPCDAVLRSRGGSPPLDLRPGAGYYGTGPDCLYVLDPDSGERRRARLADVAASAALCEALPNIDFVMSMALPEDVDPEQADLAQFAAMLGATTKPIVVSTPREGDRLRVMHEMAAACGEVGSFGCLTMSSPPLKHDHEAIDKLLVCAELGIPLVLAPAAGCGTSAPASVSAAAVVCNAEVLSGLVLHQLVSPGAPFVYGVGAGAMNMSTAVDVYCAPEAFLGDQVASDLARFYELPSWHYAACSDSKLLDGQLAAEYALATLLGGLSGATLLHDVGYLESGLQSSLDGIVLGDELVGWVRAFTREVPVNDEALAVEEIEAVGPGGNHLARPYTRTHFRSFWRPGLLDQSAHERWRSEGATTLAERVRERREELRRAPRPFRLSPETQARLLELSGVDASGAWRALT